MDIKILKDMFLTIERGNLWKRQDQIIYKRIMGDPGLLKSGSGDGERDRSGKPEENSWDSLQKVDPHRGEHLLGRTAHSARNEETIHERTGKPASENNQGKADFENFIMGSETTEFVNKVRDQVRIRQKRMSSIAENCTEHSIIWGLFMATTLNAATKLGRTELQEYEPRKATEIMMLSVERRQNSSGIFSQGSHRCSSVIKSAIL